MAARAVRAGREDRARAATRTGSASTRRTTGCRTWTSWCFSIVPDQDAADLKFRSGEIDGLDNVKPENYRWYADHQKEGNFTLYDLGPSLEHQLLLVQPEQGAEGRERRGQEGGRPYVDPVKYAWFNNPVFRRAVSMAIDRDAMIPSIFFGEAVKNWSPRDGRQQGSGTSPDVVHYDYNLDEAKKLLAEPGLEGHATATASSRTRDGQTGQLHPEDERRQHDARRRWRTSSGTTWPRSASSVTLAPVDFNTLITNLRDDFQYDAILLGLQSGVPPDSGHGPERLALERARRTTGTSASRSPRRRRRRRSTS